MTKGSNGVGMCDDSMPTCLLLLTCTLAFFSKVAVVHVNMGVLIFLFFIIIVQEWRRIRTVMHDVHLYCRQHLGLEMQQRLSEAEAAAEAAWWFGRAGHFTGQATGPMQNNQKSSQAQQGQQVSVLEGVMGGDGRSWGDQDWLSARAFVVNYARVASRTFHFPGVMAIAPYAGRRQLMPACHTHMHVSMCMCTHVWQTVLS